MCQDCEARRTETEFPQHDVPPYFPQPDSDDFDESAAKRIVAVMLEDIPYGSDAPDRAGGPDDPWRKGGMNPLGSMQFSGQRAGEQVPVPDEGQEDGFEEFAEPLRQRGKTDDEIIALWQAHQTAGQERPTASPAPTTQPVPPTQMGHSRFQWRPESRRVSAREMIEHCGHCASDPAVKRGAKVEKEHTRNPKKAAKIAQDHLKENPKYYPKTPPPKGAKERLAYTKGPKPKYAFYAGATGST